jgi:hypothetical protein
MRTRPIHFATAKVLFCSRSVNLRGTHPNPSRSLGKGTLLTRMSPSSRSVHKIISSLTLACGDPRINNGVRAYLVDVQAGKAQEINGLGVTLWYVRTSNLFLLEPNIESSGC